MRIIHLCYGKTPAGHAAPWRMRLARDLGWWSIIKLGLLALLWGTFFSSSHQCRVDASATAHRLGITDEVDRGDRCD